MEDLRKELSAYKLEKNWEEENFISMKAIERLVSAESIKRALRIRDDAYSDSVIAKSRVLFAILVLAGKEAHYETFIESNLIRDNEVFDENSLETACQLAKMSGNEIAGICKRRNDFGVILQPDHLPTLAKGVKLPWIRKQLGIDRGSYGTIHKVKPASGHLTGHEDWYAEKVISPSDHRVGNAEEWERLSREFVTLVKRKHSNIVPLIASYWLQSRDSSGYIKTLHLIFPFAERNLGAWMEKSPVQDLVKEQELQKDLYRRTFSLMAGLSFLHREIDGVITSHHDIKPSNILVFGRDFKIADFGHSRLRHLDQGSATTRQPLGTFDYEPPEYRKENGKPAERAHGRAFDAWSIGCVIIELATVIVHGWDLAMIEKFREERRMNRNLRKRYESDHKPSKDKSFHNNPNVVRTWIRNLKYQSGNPRSRVSQLLDVAENLMAEDPRSRLYTWEAELDLFLISDIHANKRRNIERISLCVQKPPATIPNGVSTPLHRAAANCDSDRVKFLLEYDWPLFVQDLDGNTPEDIIVKNAGKMNEDCLKPFRSYFEHSQWEPRRRRDKTTGMTSLQAAASGGNVDELKTILEHYPCDGGLQPLDNKYTPDIEIRTPEGKTALFLAVERNQRATIRVLLEHEAQVMTQDKLGNTPLHAIAWAQDMEKEAALLDELLTRQEALQCLEHRNHVGETPIALALSDQNIEYFQSLQDKGAVLHTVNDMGENLLHIMARTGEAETIIPYIHRFDTAEFSARNHKMMIPSMVAEKYGKVESRELIESHLLSTLGKDSKWLSWRKGDDYWQHITYTSFIRYEQIYEHCRGEDNLVRFTDFTKQVTCYWPDLKSIERVWRRLPQKTVENNILQTSHDKAYTLAVLYMLHLEKFFQSKRPGGCIDSGGGSEDGRVTEDRADLLEKFDHWIECDCQTECDQEWNFINKIGIYRPAGNRSLQCKAVNALGGSKFTSKTLKTTLLDQLRKKWKEP